MRFTTKTEYGLVSLVYMAKHYDDHVISIKDIVEKEGYPHSYIEKILQVLRLANIVNSHKGHLGGYVLARDPSDITLKEIVEALEGQTFDIFCAPDIRENIVCNHISKCDIKSIWNSTKSLLDQYYETITLDMIANKKPLPQTVQVQLTGSREYKSGAIK